MTATLLPGRVISRAEHVWSTVIGASLVSLVVGLGAGFAIAYFCTSGYQGDDYGGRGYHHGRQWDDRGRHHDRWNDRWRHDPRYRDRARWAYVEGRWVKRPFRGAVWVDGYHDRWGRWVPGYWTRARYR